MSAHLLAAIDLSRHGASPDQLLLDSVSIAIAPGERVALMGPSGAGKTLLLRCLAMLDPFETGVILWRQQHVPDSEIPQYRSHVIYLGQRGALLEGTVEENLQAPFRLQVHSQQSFDRPRIIYWLKKLGRDEKFLAKKHAQLSGGEAQITALLRALQLDPCVLLADEPTSAMDPRTAAATEAIILDWLQQPYNAPQAEAQSSARALVWVSHDAAQSQRLATRCVVLESGRVIHEGQDTDVERTTVESTSSAQEDLA